MRSRSRQVIGVLLLIGAIAAAGFWVYEQQELICDLCHRPVHSESGYTIVLESGETIESCCPRCGLRFQAGRTDVAATWAVDFSSGATLEADDAYYVENSSVNLCRLGHDMLQRDASGTQYDLGWDRCEPSLIAFRIRDDAVDFIRQNGGVMRSYEQLLEEPF